jgi:hypothetical protein
MKAPKGFPYRQPYEGRVVAVEDPEQLHRVRIELPGVWEPHGPWCFPVGGPSAGGLNVGWAGPPPIGADVLIFFVNCNPENPRYLPGHHGVGEFPPVAKVQANGANRVYADEQCVIEIDSRPGTRGVRISDRATATSARLELDTETKQVSLEASLGVLIKATGAVRIEGGTVTLNGRPVIKNGQPI